MLFLIVVLGDGTVAFKKVLKMYQICHAWIHPFLPTIIYDFCPHSWNDLNKYHFCIGIHMHIFFVPYSPSYLLSLPLSTPTSTNAPTLLPGQELFQLPVHQFVEKKWKKKDIFFSLR
jgi:hypothetical protein